MTARLGRNLGLCNCLLWAKLSGRLRTVNQMILHSGKSIGSSFSLLSTLLFQDIPHCRLKTDDTKLDRKSIIRPIYQLGLLYSINKHITAPLPSVPRDMVSTPSLTARVLRITHRLSSSLMLCLSGKMMSFSNNCNLSSLKNSRRQVTDDLVLTDDAQKKNSFNTYINIFLSKT